MKKTTSQAIHLCCLLLLLVSASVKGQENNIKKRNSIGGMEPRIQQPGMRRL
ncbi:hypothetical protein [Paraflavitalea speifideaquila]|uniref:hypothetical protein n=1 Tax=Paraflavitalea speifideaquila TaxID=3076558 RepID=UPI0028EBEFD6|nr:hypothetical protein [Paraflavitalea speifideiaquila]